MTGYTTVIRLVDYYENVFFLLKFIIPTVSHHRFKSKHKEYCIVSYFSFVLYHLQPARFYIFQVSF